MHKLKLICTTAKTESIDPAAYWHFIKPVPISDIDPMASTSLQGPSLHDLVGNCPAEEALYYREHATPQLGQEAMERSLQLLSLRVPHVDVLGGLVVATWSQCTTWYVSPAIYINVEFWNWIVLLWWVKAVFARILLHIQWKILGLLSLGF